METRPCPKCKGTGLSDLPPPLFPDLPDRRVRTECKRCGGMGILRLRKKPELKYNSL